MDLLRMMKERRSIRAFHPEKEIPAAQVDQLLEAAIWAPSAGNVQPWKFYVISDQRLKQALVRAAYGQSFIAEAPVVLAVCVELNEASMSYGTRGATLYCIQDTAAAIQNARLYARTDEALSRRLQELDSILRTSRDGYLLLDLDWRVLTINRTLADWLGLSQSEVFRHRIATPLSDGEPLIKLIGYTPRALGTDCGALAAEELRQQPPAAEELGRARSYILGSFPARRETPQQVASSLWTIESNELPADYFEQMLAKVAQTQAENCARVVRETVDPSELVIVVVGNAQELKGDLAKIAPVTVVLASGERKHSAPADHRPEGK